MPYIYSSLYPRSRTARRLRKQYRTNWVNTDDNSEESNYSNPIGGSKSYSKAVVPGGGGGPPTPPPPDTTTTPIESAGSQVLGPFDEDWRSLNTTTPIPFPWPQNALTDFDALSNVVYFPGTGSPYWDSTQITFNRLNAAFDNSQTGRFAVVIPERRPFPEFAIDFPTPINFNNIGFIYSNRESEGAILRGRIELYLGTGSPGVDPILVYSHTIPTIPVLESANLAGSPLVAIYRFGIDLNLPPLYIGLQRIKFIFFDPDANLGINEILVNYDL